MTERVMITRPNRLGIGIDVGWRITDDAGESLELWTMNTRDDESLSRLVEDAKSRYGEFEVEFAHRPMSTGPMISGMDIHGNPREQDDIWHA